MNCYLHPTNEAIGVCTSCGKSICKECAVELQGKMICRECLQTGKVAPQGQSKYDPNTAFLIELVGGFFGLLGLGHLYVGNTQDGIIRLIGWFIYNIAAYVVITLLLSIFIGLFCCPVQLVIQIGVPIWSATTLKNQLTGGTSSTAVISSGN
jgi:TM2 domain-containing membrane protein YozV